MEKISLHNPELYSGGESSLPPPAPVSLLKEHPGGRQPAVREGGSSISRESTSLS